MQGIEIVDAGEPTQVTPQPGKLRLGKGIVELAPSPRVVRTPGQNAGARRDLMVAGTTAVLDLAVIAIAYVLAKWLKVDAWWGSEGGSDRVDARMFFTLAVWVPVLFHYGLYERRRLGSPIDELAKLLHATVVSVAVVVVGAFALKVDSSRGWIAFLAATVFVLLCAERMAVRTVVGALHSRHWLGDRTLIVGVNDEARAIARLFARKPWMGYEVVGFVSDGADPVDGHVVVSTIDDIREAVLGCDASVVIVAGTSVGPEGLAYIDRALQRTDVKLRVSPSLPHVAASRVMVEPLDGLALLSLRRNQLSRKAMVTKRALDLSAALFLTAVALPVMAVIALAIRLTSRGPALFRQVRVGENGKPFTMLKFRSMVVDAELALAGLRDTNEAEGTLFKMRDDPRITGIGRRLRQLSLDELPQLFNVLRGEMSLVGPRPALPEEVARWTGEVRGRLRVKPGCTGLWQVSGRHDLPYDDYVRYDLFYVENWSLGLDLRVIARTVPALLARRGSY